MSDKEYRKYDTDSKSEYWNIRLTADAEVKGENFVKLKFASESSREDDETMWIDVIPLDGQAPISSFLKKGDVIPGVSGRLTMQRWGEDNDKISFTLKGAYLHLSPELIVELKERGFVPGSKSTSGGKKGKPAAKNPPKPAGKGRRPVVSIDDEDDGE